MTDSAHFDAVILAGGRGRRLGGVDKPAIRVGGRSLLDRALAATVAAGRVVVVGPQRTLPEGVVATTESPAGGGPVAGLVAGLGLVTACRVVVLACDLPFVTEGTTRLLLDSLAGADTDTDGAQLVDGQGRGQPLAAVYRTDRLRRAVAAEGGGHGTPMHAVVETLTMLDVETDPEQAWDCDTWDDVARARRRLNNPAEEP